MQTVRLGQAGDRLGEAAGLHVDEGKIVYYVPARVQVSALAHVERLPQAVGRLVKPTEFQAEFAMIGQGNAEEVRIPGLAQYFQAAKRMAEGGLRSLQSVIGSGQADPGLAFADTVAALAADGECLLKTDESLHVTDHGQCQTEILQRPGFPQTVSGRASAAHRDPVRVDAV